jgi:hypothetical protein
MSRDQHRPVAYRYVIPLCQLADSCSSYMASGNNNHKRAVPRVKAQVVGLKHTYLANVHIQSVSVDEPGLGALSTEATIDKNRKHQSEAWAQNTTVNNKPQVTSPQVIQMNVVRSKWLALLPAWCT